MFVPKDRVINKEDGFLIFYEQTAYLFKSRDSVFDWRNLKSRRGYIVDLESNPLIKAARKYCTKMPVNSVFISHGDTTLVEDTVHILSSTWDYYYKASPTASVANLLVNQGGITHSLSYQYPSPINLLAFFPLNMQLRACYLKDIGILKGR